MNELMAEKVLANAPTITPQTLARPEHPHDQGEPR